MERMKIQLVPTLAIVGGMISKFQRVGGERKDSVKYWRSDSMESLRYQADAMERVELDDIVSALRLDVGPLIAFSVA